MNTNLTSIFLRPLPIKEAFRHSVVCKSGYLKISLILFLAPFMVQCSQSGGQFSGSAVQKIQQKRLEDLYHFAHTSSERPCNIYIDKKVSPSVTELNDYNIRLDPDNSLIRHPLNVDCVVRQYDVASLIYWASKGDPVAEYAYIYDRIRSGYNLCGHVNYIYPEMIKYYEVSSNKKRFRPCIVATSGDIAIKKTVCRNDIKRVPELFIVAVGIKWVCGQTYRWPDNFDLEALGLDNRMFPLLGPE